MLGLTPAPGQQTPLILDALGAIALRLADSDRARRWGGRLRPDRSGTPVAELQTALAAVGVYTDRVSGEYAASTQLAVRRFQWFVANSTHRLQVAANAAPSSGTVVAYTAPTVPALTGACDTTTACELLAWVQATCRTTTLLVRAQMANFQHISRAATFTTLNYPSASDDEVLVDGGFTGLAILDAAAGREGVTLRLNQTFRVQGVAPRGAVVAPATRSQHLIGRAVDLNIVVGDNVVTSAVLRTPQAPKEAKAFVAAAKLGGLRWGGDFGAVDPPHFDQPIASASEGYDMHFFFCQRGYAAQHPMRLLGA